MILRIFVGLLICVAGFYSVRKPDIALDIVGQVDFAEKYVPGGSYAFFKLIGIIIILVGFMVMTNLYGQMINWFLDFLG